MGRWRYEHGACSSNQVRPGWLQLRAGQWPLGSPAMHPGSSYATPARYFSPVEEAIRCITTSRDRCAVTLRGDLRGTLASTGPRIDFSGPSQSEEPKRNHQKQDQAPPTDAGLVPT